MKPLFSQHLARALAGAILSVSLISLAGCSGGGADGSPTFSKSFGGPGDDLGIAAIATSDGGYLMTGIYGTELPLEDVELHTLDPMVGDLWATKLDAYGDVEWTRTLGLPSPTGVNNQFFIMARTGSDGSVWVAYQDASHAPKTGDPLQDGINVVIAKHDAGGNLLWTRTLDSGDIPGFLFPLPTTTARELVRDIWPLSNGRLLVAAIVVADVMQGNRQVSISGLWVMELSSSGTLLWDKLYLDAGGGLDYLGNDSSTSDMFVREVAPGELLVVTTGSKWSALSYRSVPETEVLRIGLAGVILNRTTHDIDVKDVTRWTFPGGGGTDGVLLVGADDRRSSSNAKMTMLDIFGNETQSWTGPGQAFNSVTARVTTSGAPQVEFWASENDVLFRYASDGTLIGTSIGADRIWALHHDPVMDLVWLLGNNTSYAVDSTLTTQVLLNQPGTTSAFSGPGNPLIVRQGILSDIAPDGTLSALSNHGGTTSTAEGGAYCMERSDGTFILTGTMFYNPENPAEPALGSWFIGLDPSGGLLWQSQFPDEGSALADGRLDSYPAVETPSGTLVSLGGSRAAMLNPAGVPQMVSEFLPSDVTAIIPALGGGFASLSGVGGLTPIQLSLLGTDLALVQGTSIDFFSNSFARAPVSLISTGDVETGGYVVAGRLFSNELAVLAFSSTTAVLQGTRIRLGSPGGLHVVGPVRIVRSADSGYLLATTVYDTDNIQAGGKGNGALIHLDDAFQPDWYRIYGGLELDFFESLEALPDGYLLAGHSRSLGVGSEAWLVRTDLEGHISDSCVALIEEGVSPATWTVQPLIITSVPVTPTPRGGLPVERFVTHLPGIPSVVDVARQCSGAATTPSDPPTGGSGNFTLTVEFVGGGTGSVVSTPTGIGCSTTCSATFAAGTIVRLDPTADVGSVFSHWTGIDQPVGALGGEVTMSADRTVQVSFE